MSAEIVDLASVRASRAGVDPWTFTSVEAVLCEDGRTVMFYAYTDNIDETFIASLTLPAVASEVEFPINVNGDALAWRRA